MTVTQSQLRECTVNMDPQFEFCQKEVERRVYDENFFESPLVAHFGQMVRTRALQLIGSGRIKPQTYLYTTLTTTALNALAPALDRDIGILYIGQVFFKFYGLGESPDLNVLDFVDTYTEQLQVLSNIRISQRQKTLLRRIVADEQSHLRARIWINEAPSSGKSLLPILLFQIQLLGHGVNIIVTPFYLLSQWTATLKLYPGLRYFIIRTDGNIMHFMNNPEFYYNSIICITENMYCNLTRNTATTGHLPICNRLFFDEVSAYRTLPEIPSIFIYYLSSNHHIFEQYDYRYKTLVPFVGPSTVTTRPSVDFVTDKLDPTNDMYYNLAKEVNHPDNQTVLDYIFKKNIKDLAKILYLEKSAAVDQFSYTFDNIQYVMKRLLESGKTCPICGETDLAEYVTYLDCCQTLCLECHRRISIPQSLFMTNTIACPFCRQQMPEFIPFLSNYSDKFDCLKKKLNDILNSNAAARVIVYIADIEPRNVIDLSTIITRNHRNFTSGSKRVLLLTQCSQFSGLKLTGVTDLIVFENQSHAIQQRLLAMCVVAFADMPMTIMTTTIPLRIHLILSRVHCSNNDKNMDVDVTAYRIKQYAPNDVHQLFGL